MWDEDSPIWACSFLCVDWLPVFALGVYVDFEDLCLGFALGPIQVSLGDFS